MSLLASVEIYDDIHCCDKDFGCDEDDYCGFVSFRAFVFRGKGF